MLLFPLIFTGSIPLQKIQKHFEFSILLFILILILIRLKFIGEEVFTNFRVIVRRTN